MIVEALLRMLIAMHKEEPIAGNILVLGKQTVALSLEKILTIFQENECKPHPDFDISNVKKDLHTRVRSNDSIDDEELFHMFGNTTYEAMDVSDYENASVIHDLNYPIPDDLEGKYDFIVDGGTFDHLFDIKTAFTNVVRLLKPGGRIFQWNAASNYANAGYTSFSADFFYDYYTLNNFTDCRTFFAESHDLGAQNWCMYRFLPPKDNKPYPQFRNSPFYVMTLVYAKKQASSTYDKMPVQLQYRDAKLRNKYNENERAFAKAHGFTYKPIDIQQADMSWSKRRKYKKLPLPNKEAYHCIGWL